MAAALQRINISALRYRPIALTAGELVLACANALHGAREILLEEAQQAVLERWKKYVGLAKLYEPEPVAEPAAD